MNSNLSTVLEIYFVFGHISDCLELKTISKKPDIPLQKSIKKVGARLPRPYKDNLEQKVVTSALSQLCGSLFFLLRSCCQL